jgi:hypothetical protein
MTLGGWVGANIVKGSPLTGGGGGGMGGGITLGGAAPVITGGVSGFVDSITRHASITAVNTWTALTYYGAVAEGNPRVPMRAKFISEIQISSAFDVDSAAAAYKLATAIKLSGAGMKNGGLYRFIGQCGSAVQVNAFATMHSMPITRYPCRIPVNPGDEIVIEGAMIAEDAGDVTISVTIKFSASDPGVGIVDGDVRFAALTALETKVSHTTFGADTLGTFKVPATAARLLGFCKSMSIDFTAGGAAQRGGVVGNLSGNGLTAGGAYRYQSRTAGYSAQGSAAGATGGEVEMEVANIPVTAGNEITAESMMIGEDTGDMAFGIGLLYG